MSDRHGDHGQRKPPNGATTPVPRALLALAAVLALEALGMLAVTVLLVVEIFTASDTATNLTSSVGLAVTTAIAAAGLAAAAIGARRARPWIRPASVVWQLLQLIVGLNALTGVGPRPDLAALLITPAVLGLVLCFIPSVVAATRRG